MARVDDGVPGAQGMLRPPWAGTRLKHLAELRTSNVDKKSVEGEQRVRLCNYTDVYYQDRITGELDFMVATASDTAISRFGLRRGDVVITKDSESRTDIAVPAYVAEDFEDLVCGYHLTIVRPRPSRAVGRFLHYAVQANGIREQFHLAASGITRFGLSYRGIADTRIPEPPLDVQRRIADLLDRETAHIDALIEKKEHLIRLLDEKRAAMITHAVTKGLNPDAPMKDSGVEWIGEIPVRWTVSPIKRLWVNAKYGISDSGRQGGSFPVVAMGHVSGGRVTIPEDRGVDELDPDLLLQPGDLLFNRTNSRELVGKVGLYDGPSDAVTFASYLVRLRLRKGAVPAYVNFLLNSGPVLTQARALSYLSINQANLNPTRYGEVRIPVPPEDDQRLIAEHLEDLEDVTSRILRANHTSITLLRERRAALITAAVTGQLEIPENPS